MPLKSAICLWLAFFMQLYLRNIPLFLYVLLTETSSVKFNESKTSPRFFDTLIELKRG